LTDREPDHREWPLLAGCRPWTRTRPIASLLPTIVHLDITDAVLGQEDSRVWVMGNLESGIRSPMHGYLRAATAAGWCGAVIGISDEYVSGFILKPCTRGQDQNERAAESSDRAHGCNDSCNEGDAEKAHGR
jgi:hypothetical protein